MRILSVALLCLLALSTAAEARRAAPAKVVCDNVDIMRPCAPSTGNFLQGVKSIKVQMHRVRHTAVRAGEHVAEYASTLLPHPAGCPRYEFCGCGAAAELGLNDRSLWLAANWLKFPRATPAPNMAAARPGHVFVLKQHIDGDVWMVADYNSGGGLSRLHARSIRGYTVVAPHT